jgi:8-amino-7-oxononanoate synthase
LLSDCGVARRRLIVTESLFSMTGDFAPLPALADLAHEHHAMLMVDEAHATGIYGQHGRGLCELFGVEAGIHIRVGTMSKALGSVGGFVAGSQRLIDWIANRARTYIFSTGLPAVAAAAGRKALWLVSSDPRQRDKLLIGAAQLRDKLRSAHLNIWHSESQIIPILVGDPARALAASAKLRQMGMFVPAIRPPSVPEGKSLLRISLTCRHTERQLDDLVTALGTLY